MIWIAAQIAAAAMMAAAGAWTVRKSRGWATAACGLLLALIILKAVVGHIPAAEATLFPWDWYPYVEPWWYLLPAMFLMGAGLQVVTFPRAIRINGEERGGALPDLANGVEAGGGVGLDFDPREAAQLEPLRVEPVFALAGPTDDRAGLDRRRLRLRVADDVVEPRHKDAERDGEAHLRRLAPRRDRQVEHPDNAVGLSGDERSGRAIGETERLETRKEPPLNEVTETIGSAAIPLHRTRR